MVDAVVGSWVGELFGSALADAETGVGLTWDGAWGAGAEGKRAVGAGGWLLAWGIAGASSGTWIGDEFSSAN